jgi:hypothetical protein
VQEYQRCGDDRTGALGDLGYEGESQTIKGAAAGAPPAPFGEPCP